MIELLIALSSFFGFGVGEDAEIVNAPAFDTDNQQIIRAIDSEELKGLNSLEAYNADQWFV